MEILLIFIILLIWLSGDLWFGRCEREKSLYLRNELLQNYTNEFVGELKEYARKDNAFEAALNLKILCCIKLFCATDSFEKLRFLEQGMGSASVSALEGKVICAQINESFGDVMLSLKMKYTDLTKDDLLYCVLLLLGCSKDSVLSCTRSSVGAFKSRRNRIKVKVGKPFFDWLIAYSISNSIFIHI